MGVTENGWNGGQTSEAQMRARGGGMLCEGREKLWRERGSGSRRRYRRQFEKKPNPLAYLVFFPICEGVEDREA